MKNLKKLPKASGIYLVTNIINNKCYIGQAKNIYIRFNSHHIYDYLNPNNCCYNSKFYQALRKYGLDNFEISILELCEEKELDEKEKMYIEQFDSFQNGYNSTEGGQSWGSNVHSEEAELKRAKTREENKSLQGENHPRAKLTNQQVWDIRQRYIDGEDIHSIYLDFQHLYKNERTFKNIVLGETYVSVGNIPTKAQKRYTNAKLTADQVREIRKRYAEEDISYEKLGKEYGISGGSVAALIKRKTYKHVD